MKYIKNRTETFKKVYRDLKMEELPVSELSTNDIQLMCAFIGKDVTSPMYGKIIGFFQWKDGRIFEFYYHVHRPRQKYSSLSNKMENIKEIVFEKDNEFYLRKLTNFGGKAFWIHTPDDYLKDDEESLCLRRFNEKNNRI